MSHPLVAAAYMHLWDVSCHDAPRWSDKTIKSVLSRLRWNVAFGASIETDHKHHAYPGGLLTHTKEVLENCEALAKSAALPKLNLDVLRTAAVFHDCMKVKDYDLEGKRLPHAKTIYHVADSYAYWMQVAAEFYVEDEIRDAVGHCILAHHGRREWGSPVEPQTPEAHILHYADYLSANFGPTRDGLPNG